MLYIEFCDLTKADYPESKYQLENGQLYEQFLTIEKIYNACEDMTKEDAARLWKQTFGKQAIKDRERLTKKIEAMSEYRDTDGGMTPAEEKTRRDLFQVVTSLTNSEDYHSGCRKVELTTLDGVTYRLKEYRVVNFHSFYRLWIIYNGKAYGTNAVHSNGNTHIHATPESLNQDARDAA